MKQKRIRITIFVLDMLLALTAIAGGIGLVSGGIAVPLNWLQGSPFNDYTIPGLALAIIVGGGSLFAAITILTGSETGVLASALAGLFIIGFESVEVAVIDRFGESWLLLAVVLQAVYIALGLVIFGLSTFLWMAEFRGQHFAARQASHS